ncbi:hypothetical protein L195_g043384, partial [Trifolium pratense]
IKKTGTLGISDVENENDTGIVNKDDDNVAEKNTSNETEKTRTHVEITENSGEIENLGKTSPVETLETAAVNTVRDSEVAPDVDNSAVEKTPSDVLDETRKIVEEVVKSVSESDPLGKSDVVPDAQASLDQQVCNPDIVTEACSDSGFSSGNADETGTGSKKADQDSETNKAVETSKSDKSEETRTGEDDEGVVGSGDKEKSVSEIKDSSTESSEEESGSTEEAESDVNKVIDVDEERSKSPPLVKTYGAGVAKRLRSNSGKAIPYVSKSPVVESVKKTVKKQMYGPPRPRSKFETPVVQKKQLKRKAVENDSDYEAEKSVTKGEASGGASVGRKSMGGRKRRVALERELGKEALKCTDIVSLIEEAGLMKTVWGLGDCYEQLVREFIVNVPEDCDNPQSPEYHKVFVRGLLVNFSPSIINEFLGRDDARTPEVELTDGELAKAITNGHVKQWPKGKKVSSSKLSMKFACLNKIGTVNWVPTVHTSDISTDLARL